MTEHTPATSTNEAFEQYLAAVNPDFEHECREAESCPHSAGLYFMVMKDPTDPDPNGYISRYHLHRIDAGRAVQAVVDFVDNLFQQNRGDAPPMVAHTKGRDLLRHAVESCPPPPAVSEELVAFMDENTEAWKGLTGE
jgi:hypothetical protein